MKSNFFLLVILVVTIYPSLCKMGNLLAQSIELTNVQSMAIYNLNSHPAEILAPNQINFNIISPTIIDSLISSIEFSVPRNGSGLLSLNNAYVYIKFKDNSISVFEIFDVWEHICKRGHVGRCYSISQKGSNLFIANAQ